MTPTIRDISEIAGVTHRTVSNVLSGKNKGIRADALERAKRIHQIAADLGYRPNGSAQAIRSGKFNVIGLLSSLTPHRSNFSSLLWQGIDDMLARRDLNLLITRLDDKTLSDESYVPKILRELSCDGLLINYTHQFPPRLQSLVTQYRVPAVWINSKQPSDCVYPDDFEAGQRAATALLERGHRRIAFITGVKAAHHSVEDRRAGCAAAAKAAGLSIELLEPADATWLAPQRLEQIRAFLKALHPTGVVTYGSMEAVTVLRVATELGWRVPEDFSLVTIGSHIDSNTGTAISTVLVDEAEVGRRATSLLLDRIEGVDTPHSAIVVPPLDMFNTTTVASPNPHQVSR